MRLVGLAVFADSASDAEARVREVQRALVERGQHRAVSIPDLLIAATAEAEGLTVWHYDADFDLIAESATCELGKALQVFIKADHDADLCRVRARPTDRLSAGMRADPSRLAPGTEQNPTHTRRVPCRCHPSWNQPPNSPLTRYAATRGT
ncbi:MAG: hypothetical protein ACRDMV_04830 [Streptosporangiales bacterium]